LGESVHSYIQRWSIIKKFSRRRLWREINRCFYNRAPSSRFRRGDGHDKTKNSSRTHGRGK
jgi:hypothetical protein